MKQNFEIRYASHPADAKHYDTAQLREHYLFENVMVDDEINMVYTMFDRLIVGGAVPAARPLELKAPDEIRADYFLERRELGMINVGGPGQVTADDTTFDVDFKEARKSPRSPVAPLRPSVRPFRGSPPRAPSAFPGGRPAGSSSPRCYTPPRPRRNTPTPPAWR